MSQKIKIRNSNLSKNNALIKNKKKKVKFININFIEKVMLKGQVLKTLILKVNKI